MRTIQNHVPLGPPIGMYVKLVVMERVSSGGARSQWQKNVVVKDGGELGNEALVALLLRPQ